MQAKEANRSGCYVIGNVRDEIDRFLNEEATLSEVIQLTIGSGEEKTKKLYNLQDIYDLQSRLMLLGGGSSTDKQAEKEYFLQVIIYK